jgi:hypothetical protein
MLAKVLQTMLPPEGDPISDPSLRSQLILIAQALKEKDAQVTL